MSSTNSDLYNTTKPLTYSEWSRYNATNSFQKSSVLYETYIKDWYIINSKTNLVSQDQIKQDYVRLLKELSYFFSEEERDLFLRDIDYTNDVEIIYAIPFFVDKLKKIALTISKKRDYIKNNRKKFAALGTSSSLESILYEHILKSYTKSDFTTQISISSLGATFPELSAIKDDLIIEIEELYDNNAYVGVDPLLVDAANYIPRVGNNVLFDILTEFLNQDLNLLSLSSYNTYTIDSTPNIYTQIDANSKYLGNTLYGLTATKIDETTTNTVFFDIVPGNNWFYWPSGETYTDVDITQNYYRPITLQDSAFTTSESTGGSSYLDSDLFFAETKTGIEGAWLRGTTVANLTSNMVVTIQPGITRSFIYPVPGYELSTTYTYLGRKADDDNLRTFNLLDPELKSLILKQYFNKPLETQTVSSVYINNTSLVACSANAGVTSMHGDLIIKRTGGPYNTPETPIGLYNDVNATESAFLYKITSTEIPIDSGSNYIYWPLLGSTNSNYNHTIEITTDTCNDVYLTYTNVSKYMIGAVAGESVDTADTIRKLTKRNGDTVEAAWLYGGSVKDLATYNSYSIPVYDTPAINCTTPPSGAIQPNLSFLCRAGEKVSFVWCDVDTPANKVFRHIPHALDCKYTSTRHNYLNNDADDSWTQCTCKSVYYSPIGHTGEDVTKHMGCADYLFADPQGLGTNFTFPLWRDTRNFNYKNSPQFAYFKRDDTGLDTVTGWGPGTWQTGDGSDMILKTGRRYTYFRSTLKNINSDRVPGFAGRYAYRKIISSVQSEITYDVVLAVDISGSEYYSIEKTKILAQKIASCINTNQGSQVGLVIFNKNSVVASYLTKDKKILVNAINQISVNSIKDGTNIEAGLTVASKLLTMQFGLNVNQPSLVGICSNLNVSIQTPFTQIKTTNLPLTSNKKAIILFSDGVDTTNKKDLIAIAANIKNKNIKILAVDIGPNASSSTYMEQMASTPKDYFNYERALLQNDSADQIDFFNSGIIADLYDNISTQPIWKKAALVSGVLYTTNEVSDMILSPGDYFEYNHQESISYDNSTTSSGPCIISIPLYGWSYDTCSYDGRSLGAKPYWGKAYNTPDTANNFNKTAREMGGHVRFFNDYIPITHPEISEIKFNTNDYIEYRNNGCNVLVWSDIIKYTTTESNKVWLKLKSCVQAANLRELFNSNSIDKIFEQTEEPSDIILTTFTDYIPTYYCYYARNAFSVLHNLILDASTNIYSNIQTGIAIQAIAPYFNLTNTHYASIASQYTIDTLFTRESVGRYLLPDKIGVPYYLGRGYTNALDPEKISKHTEEHIYLDPNIYTSNRGLTKADQYSPYTTIDIDNTWIKESYNSGKKAGVIINSISFQKFVPYQSNYETYKHNAFGLSRQDDVFEFWSGPNNNIWNDEAQYSTNYKKEAYKLKERTDSLLVTDKTLAVWQTDLDGNNYGIYKDINNTLTQKQIKQTAGELWVRDVNNLVVSGSVALRDVYENYTEYTSHYNSLTSNNIINIIAINNNTLIVQTSAGISIDQTSFNYTTGKIEVASSLPAYISLENSDLYYAGSWYNERDKKVYFNTFSAAIPHLTPTIVYTIYEYDLNLATLSILLKDTITSPYATSYINNFPQFTYNRDAATFNTTFIFKSPDIAVTGDIKIGNPTFNLFSINVKNLKNNPYISSVQCAV